MDTNTEIIATFILGLFSGTMITAVILESGIIKQNKKLKKRVSKRLKF